MHFCMRLILTECARFAKKNPLLKIIESKEDFAGLLSFRRNVGTMKSLLIGSLRKIALVWP